MARILLLSTITHIGWVIGQSILAHHNLNNFYGWFISVSGMVASLAGGFNVDLDVSKNKGKNAQYAVWLVFSVLYTLFSMTYVATNSYLADACVNSSNHVSRNNIIIDTDIRCDAWFLSIACSAACMFIWLLGSAQLAKDLYNAVPPTSHVMKAEVMPLPPPESAQSVPNGQAETVTIISDNN